jgi:hypothetical protein
VQHPTAVLDEAPHRVGARAVRPQVLGRREALLDAAIEAGQGTHLVGSLSDRAVTHRQQHEYRDAEVDEHPEADAPVEEGEHPEHAGDQQDAADRLGHDLREEVRHRRHVAVDALDQLARCVRAVELVVEPEHVARHPQTQLVGGAPRRDRREAGHDDTDELRRHRDREEDEGQADERRRRRAIGGLVNDRPHHQRPGERQRRTHRQERAEDGPTAGVGPEQGDEGAPARRRCSGHQEIVVPERSFRRTGFGPLATGPVSSWAAS